jgi:hypothetical protein
MGYFIDVPYFALTAICFKNQWIMYKGFQEVINTWVPPSKSYIHFRRGSLVPLNDLGV